MSNLNNARAHTAATNDHNGLANFQLTRRRHRTHCRKTTATQNGSNIKFHIVGQCMHTTLGHDTHFCQATHGILSNN